MRQGNDVGTQYRSAIYWTTPEQEKVARELTAVYGDELRRRRLGEITTEIREVPTYYYAEDLHQQYLAKNPHGYRCHANTGVKFPETPGSAEVAGPMAAVMGRGSPVSACPDQVNRPIHATWRRRGA